jgi:hypothetical protein
MFFLLLHVLKVRRVDVCSEVLKGEKGRFVFTQYLLISVS